MAGTADAEVLGRKRAWRRSTQGLQGASPLQPQFPSAVLIRDTITTFVGVSIKSESFFYVVNCLWLRMLSGMTVKLPPGSYQLIANSVLKSFFLLLQKEALLFPQVTGFTNSILPL